MARVLVAEHDEAARRFLQAALALGDHEVRAVGTGSEAIRELAQSPLDVVITDHLLPEVSGIDVIAAAQRLEPDLCCLVLAGPTDADVTVRAMEAGAVGVIPKPATVRQVLLHVARAAERRELARQARRARIMDSILERAGVPLMTGTQHAAGLRLPWWGMADAGPTTPDAPAAARPGTASSHAEEDV
jgi:DNA-binding NtrC family response regulator